MLPPLHCCAPSSKCYRILWNLSCFNKLHLLFNSGATKGKNTRLQNTHSSLSPFCFCNMWLFFCFFLSWNTLIQYTPPTITNTHIHTHTRTHPLTLAPGKCLQRQQGGKRGLKSNKKKQKKNKKTFYDAQREWGDGGGGGVESGGGRGWSSSVSTALCSPPAASLIDKYKHGHRQSGIPVAAERWPAPILARSGMGRSGGGRGGAGGAEEWCYRQRRHVSCLWKLPPAGTPLDAEKRLHQSSWLKICVWIWASVEKLSATLKTVS